jgi:hypothetical protein
MKDVTVIRGRNLYPLDIEQTVQHGNPSIRPGCGAAFSVDGSGEEQLIVVQKLEYRANPDQNRVLQDIRQSVSEEHEVSLQVIVLIDFKDVKRENSPAVVPGALSVRKTRSDSSIERFARVPAGGTSNREYQTESRIADGELHPISDSIARHQITHSRSVSV